MDSLNSSLSAMGNSLSKMTDGMNEMLGGGITTGIGVTSTVAGVGMLAAAIAAPEITFPVIMAGAIGTAATIGGGISFCNRNF